MIIYRTVKFFLIIFLQGKASLKTNFLTKNLYIFIFIAVPERKAEIVIFPVD